MEEVEKNDSRSDTDCKKVQMEEVEKNDSGSDTDCKEPACKKSRSEKKREKKRLKIEKRRGQNKGRPYFKEDRSIKLCRYFVDGTENVKVPLPHANCNLIHDIESYIKLKPEDIGKTCYIYSVRGYCQYGLTCRFGSGHIDEKNQNMKSEIYDENYPKQIFNQIPGDLIIALRKRTYNFNLSNQLIEQNQKKDDKPMGFTPDTDLIKDDEPKKKINFSNKLFLSPLTTLGNLPFRRICKEYGADITCGEMACAIPIINGHATEWALTKRHISEDIFGVQLCGHKANLIAYAAQLLKENAKIDFIDLNLGCPIDLIYKQGGGSALLHRLNVLQPAIRTCATILGDIPFTIKTRTGIYANKSIAHTLIPKFEEWGASLVTVHGRSREQRYSKTADWEYIEKCAQQAKSIPILGNGDILTYDDYVESRKKAPSISSIMIGRGALMKPWIFQEIKEQKTLDPSSTERFELLQKFVNYGLEYWGSDTKGVENTRRFLLEWQSFLYRYVPYGILINKPQKVNVRGECLEHRDEMEKLMASSNCNDWIKLSEMLLGRVPESFQFLPKHKANAY